MSLKPLSLALIALAGCATTSNPDTITPEQRQIRVDLPIPPPEAFQCTRTAFVEEAISLDKVDPVGLTIASAPIELAAFGVIKDLGFLRATIIATDNGSAVILSGSYVPNIDATWRKAASGLDVEASQREITSVDNIKAAEVGWARLEAIAARLRGS